MGCGEVWVYTVSIKDDKDLKCREWLLDPLARELGIFGVWLLLCGELADTRKIMKLKSLLYVEDVCVYTYDTCTSRLICI